MRNVRAFDRDVKSQYVSLVRVAWGCGISPGWIVHALTFGALGKEWGRNDTALRYLCTPHWWLSMKVGFGADKHE